jgi:uncharacterized protein YndB with AHSA1/START domain
VFEERVGGHIYEVDADGGASTWGTVLEWDAPSRVRFTWHPGREPDTAQEVEIRFAPSARGTTLELVHTGWEVLGRDAAKARRGYSIGWIPVLDVWADRRSAAGLLVNGLFGVVLLVQGLAGRRKRSSPSSPSSGRSG